MMSPPNSMNGESDRLISFPDLDPRRAYLNHPQLKLVPTCISTRWVSYRKLLSWPAFFECRRQTSMSSSPESVRRWSTLQAAAFLSTTRRWNTSKRSRESIRKTPRQASTGPFPRHLQGQQLRGTKLRLRACPDQTAGALQPSHRANTILRICGTEGAPPGRMSTASAERLKEPLNMTWEFSPGNCAHTLILF
ncbi:hypothetical protein N657DRAFT_287712 [Parathielavia appendiculata]|uniref:Uncharacterized protein n=1 Tax=Parathielavia appendiculata TaxID=2587402 RepID=A0AAN6Z5H9_9PEZI|nr:hypothetical protein N657DRAFT_287712 [Parathielavia appendiculata]